MMNPAQKMLAEAQKLTAMAMEELSAEKTDGFADEDRAEKGMIAKMPSPTEDPWFLKELRTQALAEAIRANREGDDDHAIVARAGRFLTFLKEGA